jgi:hypothetical protein
MNNPPIIHHVCSLGNLCFSSTLIKRNNLKTESYPFDWILSNQKMILHCIKDRFRTFLNRDYYIPFKGEETARKCGHSYYHEKMFNHHDPRNGDDYNYFIRCIERFNKLLSVDNNKLFIVSYHNAVRDDYQKIRQEIKELNALLKKYCINYYIFVVMYMKCATGRQTIFSDGNITFCELQITSIANGSGFDDPVDENTIDRILKREYTFDIKPLDSIPCSSLQATRKRTRRVTLNRKPRQSNHFDETVRTI